MPRKKVTFLVIPENTARVMQLRVSRAFLATLVCIVCTGIAIFFGIFHKYVQIKDASAARQVSAQQEVSSQRAQLQFFAQKINEMRSKVIALHELEKKVRSAADLVSRNGTKGSLGVGGPASDDLGGMPLLPMADGRNDITVETMREQLGQLDQASTLQIRSLEELYASLDEQRAILASTPSQRPAPGWYSSGFGYRNSPFTGGKEFHKGIDISTPQGTPVVAPADGRVTYAGPYGSLGTTVVIDHGHGIITRYGHLDKLFAKRGHNVSRGEEIASVGSTGRSTAPHLHYEVYQKGVPVNPFHYIVN